MQRIDRTTIEMLAWVTAVLALVMTATTVTVVVDAGFPVLGRGTANTSASSRKPFDPSPNLFQFSVSPDGGRYISRGMKNHIAVRETASGRLLQTCNLYDKQVAQISPLTANQFSAAYLNGSAAVWIEGGGVFRPRLVHQYDQPLHSTDLLKDGSLVAFGRSDGVIDVWDARQLTRRHSLRLDRAAISSVQFSQDGKRLLAADREGRTRIWDLAAAGEPKRLPGRGLPAMRASISPEGRYVVTGSVDGAARVWDVELEEVVLDIPSGGMSIVCVVFSPAGDLVALRTVAGEIKVWDVARQVELDCWYSRGTATHIEFCADEGQLWYADNSNGCVLKKWRFETAALPEGTVPALSDDEEQGPHFLETLR